MSSVYTNSGNAVRKIRHSGIEAISNDPGRRDIERIQQAGVSEHLSRESGDSAKHATRVGAASTNSPP
jgi:hypothetical protein